jgi:hypothetical protein
MPDKLTGDIARGKKLFLVRVQPVDGSNTLRRLYRCTSHAHAHPYLVSFQTILIPFWEQCSASIDGVYQNCMFCGVGAEHGRDKNIMNLEAAVVCRFGRY